MPISMANPERQQMLHPTANKIITMGKYNGTPAALTKITRRLHRRFIAAGLMLLWLGCLATAYAQNPRPFMHPDRIRYDSHCLTIDGKDVFLYSGAFHYFRCPKPLWHDRFQKIKDAGFNSVETYVAWNWCEPKMPSGINDYSKADMTDLDDFLKMAEDFGLYVLVRPGPYICAEWDTGGYPQWLMTKMPKEPLRDKGWLRTDDPVYLAWCQHWYHEVCPVIAKHQITRRAPGQGGVIMVQLENEYDYAGLPADVMLNQVRALGIDARVAGIDVPLFTCWTHPVRGSKEPFMQQVFDACNFYPRWGVDGVKKDIEKLRREQPDAPLATTELQGGWFAQVGGKLSEDQDGVTAAQINNLTLFTIQNGETILNYYMLFGGTNPDDWAARDLTASYDYNAPIREWGGVGDRYQRIWALGHMLREHGAKIARSEVVESTVTGVTNDVTVVVRQAVDGSRYLFVRTSQHNQPRSGTAHVKPNDGALLELAFDYQLEPFGSKVLYLPPGVNDAEHGEWLPKAAPAVERPTELPAAVPIATAVTHEDFGPVKWTRVKPEASLSQAGINDSHFIFYSARITAPLATNLLVDFPGGDAVLATINGEPAKPASGMPGSSLYALAAGTNEVALLYENRGHPNGGEGMQRASGIGALHLTAGLTGGGQPIGGWRMHLVDGTSKRPEVKTDFDDASWQSVAVDQLEADQLQPDQTAVFRAGVDLKAAELTGKKMILTLARVDDLGWVYVNGHNLGKTTDWGRTWTFDATKQLVAGHNVIAIVVKNTDGHGGLGLPALGVETESGAVPFAGLGRPTGDDQLWTQPGFDDQAWKLVTLGATNEAKAAGAMLNWYRMNFTLPAPQAGVWVPWHVRLFASGNGFLYLNGHGLGRYWEAGPQHDFFLPDCWLNTGPGQKNILTLNLRPTDKGAAIQSAVVEPYSQFAEKR